MNGDDHVPSPVPFPESFNDAEVAEQLDAAAKAGRWMVAVWRCETLQPGAVTLFRKTHDWPIGQLDVAMGLLGAEFKKIKKNEGGGLDPDALPKMPRPSNGKGFKFLDPDQENEG